MSDVSGMTNTLRSIALYPANLQFEIENTQLDLFDDYELDEFHQEPYLYKISSLYNEDYDPDFAPVITSARDLPELTSWTAKFAHGVLEIWAGKRPPSQLSKWCHPSVYKELSTSINYQREVGKLRKIYIHEPLDGLCESIATVRYKDRLRSMAMRFEGVDRKWLCTSLDLL